MAPHTPSMAACNHRHLEHADAPPPPNGPALDQAQPKPRKTLMPRPTPQPLPHSPPNRGQRRAAPDRLRPAGDAHAHPQPVLRASSAASRGTRKSGAPPWSISTDLMKLSRTANARRSTQQRPKHAQPNLTCRSSVWAAAPRPEQGQPYPPDACAYCFYRPKAKGQDSRPNNPDFWRFGTGDGAHFPGMCDCFKRYLAEGGDASDPPNGRQFLQSALRERRRTA